MTNEEQKPSNSCNHEWVPVVSGETPGITGIVKEYLCRGCDAVSKIDHHIALCRIPTPATVQKRIDVGPTPDTFKLLDECIKHLNNNNYRGAHFYVSYPRFVCIAVMEILILRGWDCSIERHDPIWRLGGSYFIHITDAKKTDERCT